MRRSAHDAFSVAGIPFIHEVAPGLQVPDRIATGWKGSRTSEPPIRIHHAHGDAAPRGLRPLFEVPLPLGEYYLDDQGDVAIRSRVMGEDGFSPQLLRTRRAGFEYEIEYSNASESHRLHWAWQRTIFMLALPLRARGITLHATGFLLPNGEAVACPGISGAGKSTLARMLQTYGADRVRLLSDDRIAVTTDSEGLRAWGTPWFSSAEAAAADDGLLRALVFVTHGQGARLAPLSASGALRRLLRTVGFPFWNHEATVFALDVVDRLLSELPCFEFTYAPSQAAARTLVEAMTSVLGAGA